MELLDEVAGKEAQALTRLHGGPGEDDTRHLALHEGGHGHSHREIGLARPRGADGDDEVVVADGVEVTLLVGRLRADELAPRGHRDSVGEKTLEIRLGLGARHAERGTDVRRAQGGPLAEHLDQVAHHLLRLLDPRLLPPQGHVVAPRGRLHVVLRLQEPQVLVVAAEQGQEIEVGRDDDAPGGVGDVGHAGRGPSTTRMPRSRSWRASTGAGASVRGQVPFWVFGNAMTSRIDSCPTRLAARRSRPKAMPPMGGAPNSSASSRKPKRARASSLEMPRRAKRRSWTEVWWMRIEPPAASWPFSTRS